MRSLLLIASLLLTACQNREAKSPVNSSERLLMATLYHQTAAEYRALCYQSYNLAKLRLDEALKTKMDKKPAVIVDVDETVLDNSNYEARQILDGTSYSFETWKTWTDLCAAIPVPGALEFLKYAASKGVDVFYVTNRKLVEKQSTTENLRKMGFPNADTAFVMPRTTEGSKEPRRRAIQATHEIVLLCGDNLNDFSSIFEDKPTAERFAVTDSVQSLFGSRFIVLPNPMYGDWDTALFNGQRGLSDSAKTNLRKAALRSY